MPKAVTVIKEDRQAFGLLLSKDVDLAEALKYSITSLPLSIATPDSKLRSDTKHLLRNLIIDEALIFLQKMQFGFTMVWLL